jgi:uncharacterized protein (TIGR02231 family)
MKNFLFIVLFAFALSSVTLDGQEKYIPVAVSQVTVFRQGAQLYGELPLSVQPGTVDIVAGGLSPYIDPNSIQVRGEGDFMIMGVNHRNNYLENPAETAIITGLRDKIEALSDRIEDENTAIDVLLEKEQFLKANYDVVTNKSAITPEQLKSLLDIYSSNTESIKTAVLKKRRVIKEYEKEKQQLENQLASTTDRSKMPTGEIVVTVSGTMAVSGRLKLSYVVMNAGWYPSYDIRVDDISSPASVIYRANIWQKSGIDWKDVKVSLSNATPMTSGALPTLNPWFIDFYTVSAVPKALQGKVAGVNISSKREVAEVTDEDLFMVAESAPLPVTVSESNISFSFDVNVAQTIMADGKPELVELQRLTVPATYSYASTPKISTSAFLMGYITDWEKYNFLPGESNIYFSNTFTGKGFINTAELTDTLPVSLGADNNITVRREKRTDFSSHRLIGANRIDVLSFLISVRNNKSQAATIKLRDQIPLSQNSDITVEAVELTGGNLNTVTGEAVWDLKVEPRETKEVILTYSVKYPKNRKVILE